MVQPLTIFLFPWVLAAASAAKKNLIIETDLMSDVDDAGALLLAATSSKVNLLAVNVNHQSRYSALCASAILAHYGRGRATTTTPVGIRRPLTDETFFDGWSYELGEFASKVAYHWSGGPLPWGRADDAWDPVALYRKVLAENDNVTIASIGFLDNLSALLNSTADEYSSLSGHDLVAAKVSELVVMGGAYPSGREFNFYGSDPLVTAHVVHSWPGPMVFSGLELGAGVLTGVPLMRDGPTTDPVRAAYTFYTYNRSRPSWDPLTVLYALDGLDGGGGLFEFVNEDGYNSVAPDGSNAWVSGPQVTNQHWLRLTVDDDVATAELDRLFLEGAWSVAGGTEERKEGGRREGEEEETEQTRHIEL